MLKLEKRPASAWVAPRRWPTREAFTHDVDRNLARVLESEHKIYPLAVSMFASGRLEFRDAQAWLDGAPLSQPVQYVGSGIRL